MDHYKKSGKAAVDLQISKIQRKRKAEKEAKKARQEAAALTNDDDDEQQEEEQQKKPAQPVASTSKKRAREPTPAHDSMDDDDSDAPPPVSRKERIPFDDDAYAVLVRTMAKVEERKWTKKAVFEDLADKVRSRSQLHLTREFSDSLCLPSHSIRNTRSPRGGLFTVTTAQKSRNPSPSTSNNELRRTGTETLSLRSRNPARR